MIPAPPDVAFPPADALSTPGGVHYKFLAESNGDKPDPWDHVTVDYTGWTTDGNMFDSSILRGQTATFPLNGVIKGWQEGLQVMGIGSKVRLWIPGELAYGDQPGRPNGMLVFDVELHAIKKGTKPPEAPEDVAAAPADALKTATGLRYKSLSPPTSMGHPNARSQVTVHYSGWTTDGKLFDSSLLRGQPATFGLNQVIPGWTEGLQKMQPGEKMRFWIPGRLAYGDTPQAGRPYGTLVFDVHLIRFR